MNLAIKDIRHGLFRFVLTCFGLGLLMTVVLAMIGIYNGLVADALAVVKAPAADIWVVEAGTQGPFAEASSIPADTRDAVARMPGVAEAGAITYQTIEAAHAGQTLRLYVIGFEPGRPGGPQRIAEGRGLGTSHFELLADRKTGLVPGDTIRLGRNRFRVVGLAEDAMNSGGDPAVYVTLADALSLQTALDPAAARVQVARGDQGIRPATVAAVIARLEPGADVALLDRYFGYALVIALLMAIGSVAVAAASPASARRLSTNSVRLDDLHFFTMHIRYQFIGLIAMFGASMLPKDMARRAGIAAGTSDAAFPPVPGGPQLSGKVSLPSARQADGGPGGRDHGLEIPPHRHTGGQDARAPWCDRHHLRSTPERYR